MMLTSFQATVLPLSESKALYTTLNEPRPISSYLTYRPLGDFSFSSSFFTLGRVISSFVAPCGIGSTATGIAAEVGVVASGAGDG